MENGVNCTRRFTYSAHYYTLHKILVSRTLPPGWECQANASRTSRERTSRVSNSSSKNQRSLVSPASGMHTSLGDRKRATESHNEGPLTEGPYFELGDDGKSDQSFAMTTVEVIRSLPVTLEDS